MPFAPMPTPIRCPQCNTSFIVEVRTIVDVGDEPELKEQLLRGQVNYARCPNCGAGGMLSSPLLYHDPEKELLISYIPSEMGYTADQQEHIVGGLVNAVMNRLPPEQRKGYFLQPRTAITLDGLFDAILEADGVSREVLERQRARLRLVNELLAAVDDDKTLDALVEQHHADLDYEFFLLLSDFIDADEAGEEDEHVMGLSQLREKLLQRVSPAMPRTAPQSASYDELIDMLSGEEAAKTWQTTIALNRQRLDYGFFQALTARIGAARTSGDAEAAEALTGLRQSILDELDAQNRLVREAEDQASLLVMQLLEAQDLKAAVREHRDEIDDVFLMVIARLQAAAARKDQARAAKLAAILGATLEMLEENLPPEGRLMNRLLRTATADEAGKVLEEHRGLLNDAFLVRFDEYLAELERRGEDAALLEHLRQVRGQIQSKITILRA
jgi:hypothetical protein